MQLGISKIMLYICRKEQVGENLLWHIFHSGRHLESKGVKATLNKNKIRTFEALILSKKY